MKKTIVIFCASLSNGGAERVIVNLVHHFVDLDLNVNLIVTQLNGGFQFDLSPRVNIINLKSRRVLTSIPGLILQLRKLRPDIFFTALDYVNIVGIFSKILSRIACRTIISVHAQLRFFIGDEATISGRFRLLLLKFFYKKADMIVATSNGLANEIKCYLNLREEQVASIYNPIINDILRQRVSGNIIRNSKEKKIILAVCRLAPEKDLQTLINAFYQVRKQIEVKLHILGEGPLKADLQSLVHSLKLDNYVEFLGFQLDPYKHFMSASCFVLSSTSEGFGNVLVEALVCGCSIVSTDCPYGPREILEDGKWGTLVPVGDIRAMEAAILEVFSGKPKFDFSSLSEHLKKYDSELISKKYLDIFLGKS